MKAIYTCLTYIIFTLVVTSVSAADSASCNENRCINNETNNLFGWKLSFKPVYKNTYDIALLEISKSCEADADINPIILPKNSFFKQTLDNEAQNSNEIIVHVYETDILSSNLNIETNKQKTIDTFFNTPFKVCLNGKHRVAKSLYNRVGGVNTGVLVIPFKFRNGDVFSDTAIGPYISYKWEVVEILATAGISQISVSEIGSEDVESETGLTAALGVNFEIDTNWDVAFLVGFDHLSGEKGENWKYQDKAWISFGIGFNFTR